mmetsp:Transcript_40635/g.91350  ORF Transcript_40635/g.91350 Transcript_40635/m.91350 type:complete len:208 (-) Transcript_40635:668-1291(-)
MAPAELPRQQQARSSSYTWDSSPLGLLLVLGLLLTPWSSSYTWTSSCPSFSFLHLDFFLPLGLLLLLLLVLELLLAPRSPSCTWASSCSSFFFLNLGFFSPFWSSSCTRASSCPSFSFLHLGFFLPSGLLLLPVFFLAPWPSSSSCGLCSANSLVRPWDDSLMHPWGDLLVRPWGDSLVRPRGNSPGNPRGDSLVCRSPFSFLSLDL